MPLRAVMCVGIDPDLDKDFREVIGQIKGYGRGALRDSLEEAIQLWIREKRKEIK